jgi:hypothetical protein
VLSSLLLLALSLGDGDRIEDFEDTGSETWERVVSDSHPPYNIIERVEDPESAKSGHRYLHFRSMGGSTAVRRSAGHPWPVDAGRPYRVSVWVRLSGAHRNAATLSLTWTRESGEVLAVQTSEPLRSAKDWTRLEIDVPAAPAGAAGILPGLQFEGTDVRGVCDFDLLELHPTKRLEIRAAGRSLPLFTPQDYPRFTLRPSGLPSGIHTITVTMTSATENSVRRTASIDVPGQTAVAVDFPPAPPGLYTLQGSVDQQEASRRIAVLIVSPGAMTGDAESPEPIPAVGDGPVATSLGEHLLDPRRRFVPKGGFFEADGTPKGDYYAGWIADTLLAGTEPLGDPGLFPSTVRVAAFRKGGFLGFALWTEAGSVRLPWSLNEGALLRPLYGTARLLAPGEEIVVQPVPTFLLQVDPLLADLRLDVSPTELPLQLSPVRLTLRLQNRSRADIAGAVEISLDSLPAGWRASTRQFRMAALAAGAEQTVTVDLVVPPGESERDRDLKLGLRFTVRGKEVSIQALKRLTLKSPIRLESSVSATKTLGIRISNGSDHPMTLSVRSRVPGLAERLDLIRDLPPGANSRVLEFPVQEAGTAEIFVQESGGDRALTRRLIPLP